MQEMASVMINEQEKKLHKEMCSQEVQSKRIAHPSEANSNESTLTNDTSSEQFLLSNEAQYENSMNPIEAQLKQSLSTIEAYSELFMHSIKEQYLQFLNATKEQFEKSLNTIKEKCEEYSHDMESHFEKSLNFMELQFENILDQNKSRNLEPVITKETKSEKPVKAFPIEKKSDQNTSSKVQFDQYLLSMKAQLNCSLQEQNERTRKTQFLPSVEAPHEQLKRSMEALYAQSSRLNETQSDKYVCPTNEELEELLHQEDLQSEGTIHLKKVQPSDSNGLNSVISNNLCSKRLMRNSVEVEAANFKIEMNCKNSETQVPPVQFKVKCNEASKEPKCFENSTILTLGKELQICNSEECHLNHHASNGIPIGTERLSSFAIPPSKTEDKGDNIHDPLKKEHFNIESSDEVSSNKELSDELSKEVSSDSFFESLTSLFTILCYFMLGQVFITLLEQIMSSSV